jgi:uncharacterized membrane protein
MKPENRVLLFCLTLFLVAPSMYVLGEWLEGTALAVLLPISITVASYWYARAGERERAARESRPL